jgi:hypothetical protein
MLDLYRERLDKLKPRSRTNSMTELSGTIGFVIIVIWYAGIGLLATAGSVAVTQKFFPGRSEQMFYGAVFVLITGVYLAFTAYFGNGAV